MRGIHRGSERRGVAVSQPIPAETERVAKEVVDAAYAVHTALGPGLLESVYETCLLRELALRKLAFKHQVELPILYKGVTMRAGLRLDVVVEDRVVVELKALDAVLAVHEAQLLSYLRLSGHRLGLLINFNVPLIKDGIRRMVV